MLSNEISVSLRFIYLKHRLDRWVTLRSECILVHTQIPRDTLLPYRSDIRGRATTKPCRDLWQSNSSAVKRETDSAFKQDRRKPDNAGQERKHRQFPRVLIGRMVIFYKSDLCEQINRSNIDRYCDVFAVLYFVERHG